MIIPITFLFVAVGYLCYKSKDKVSLVEVSHLKTTKEKKEKDNLYNEPEDLFI